MSKNTVYFPNCGILCNNESEIEQLENFLNQLNFKWNNDIALSDFHPFSLHSKPCIYFLDVTDRTVTFTQTYMDEYTHTFSEFQEQYILEYTPHQELETIKSAIQMLVSNLETEKESGELFVAQKKSAPDSLILPLREKIECYAEIAAALTDILEHPAQYIQEQYDTKNMAEEEYEY